MVMLPQPGSVFATLICIDDRVDMILNLPKVLATNGRFDAFINFLQQRLANPPWLPTKHGSVTANAEYELIDEI